MRSLVCFLLLLSLGACSTAPVLSSRSARSLGEGKQRIQLMPGLPVLGVSYERGFSENFDLGLGLELQLTPVYSAFGKYAFISNEQGWSLAALGGGFYGTGIVDSYGGYAGPITSWRKNWFEIFLFPRYNYVQWRGLKRDSQDDTDSLFFDVVDDVSRAQFHYLQTSLGMNFHTSERFSFGVGVSHFVFLQSRYVKGSSVGWLPELSFAWAF